MNALRTFIFYSWLVVLTLLSFIPCLCTVVLPAKWRNQLMMVNFCRVVLWSARIICGLRVEVQGREHLANLPKDQGVVILSKHQSTWETFFLPTLLHPQVPVVKIELAQLPLFGWCLRLMKPIFIDRNHKTGALKQVLAQGADRLSKGIHVLIFPEGTRVPPGQRRVFSKGGAMLASKANAPVVAIAHNSGEHWPNDSWIKRPGTIKVVISTLQQPPHDIAQLNEWSENWINQQVDQVAKVPFTGLYRQQGSSGKRF